MHLMRNHHCTSFLVLHSTDWNCHWTNHQASQGQADSGTHTVKAHSFCLSSKWAGMMSCTEGKHWQEEAADPTSTVPTTTFASSSTYQFSKCSWFGHSHWCHSFHCCIDHSQLLAENSCYPLLFIPIIQHLCFSIHMRLIQAMDRKWMGFVS